MSEYESLLPEALEYASYGFKVFALSPLSKIPRKSTKGFKEATNDQEEIFNIFNNEQAYNLGVSMVDSDIFVLDIDNHKGNSEGLQSLNKLMNGESLPDDVTIVETVNGGYHIYFKAPAGVEIKQQIGFMPSVDIIKNYVVGAGSSIKKEDGSIGTYKLENGSLDDIKEVPPAILKALMNKEQPMKQGSTYKADYNNTAGRTKKYTALLLEELTQGVQESQRNIWLSKYTGKLLYLGMDPAAAYQFLMVVNENFIEPPLADDEVNKVFKSILKAENNKRKGVS